MAKSQIIKDIANGVVSLEITLKRALVIAHDLKNEKLINWINSELYGYKSSKNLPEYRHLPGNLKMSYIGGSVQVTNQSVGTSVLPAGYEDANVYKCCDSISTIEQIINSGNTPSVSLSEYIPYLRLNSPRINVMNFFSEIPLSAFKRVTDNVSKEIMSILLKIDDEVGNLDELDVQLSKDKQEHLNNDINIFVERLISIGDNNKIEKTNISSEGINDHVKK